MYCSFCGRELPKGEGCTCCRAVSERNNNPNYKDKKSFFRTGTPEDFNHTHAVNYKTDEFGKFDSCQYGGEDHHTRPSTYTTTTTTRPNVTRPTVANNRVVTNTKSGANSNQKQSGCGGVFFFIILWIILSIIMGYSR